MVLNACKQQGRKSRKSMNRQSKEERREEERKRRCGQISPANAEIKNGRSLLE